DGIHTIYGKTKSPYNGVFNSKEEEQEYFWQNYYLKKLNFLQSGYLENKMIDHKDPEEEAYLKSFHRKILAASAEAILKEHAENVPYVGTKAVTDLEQLFYVYPNAKVLTIVRDGRDVVVSKRFHSMRMGVYMHGDEKSRLHYLMNEMLRFRAVVNSLDRRFKLIKPKKHFKDISQPENLLNKEVIVKFATEWHRKVDYIADFEERFPNNIHRLHYESLKDNPEQKMKDLFTFMEVPANESIIEQVAEATSFKSYETTGKSSFFRKGETGEWQKYFNDSHKALFKEIAGPTLIRLGYETDNNW
ncbi:MAG: sulfotransferase domain-containing protein, partial [Phaeodactylibacter sp.]|nr:sulfotransferase domain-containing protein [Phaeodactylibacter sp.]